MNTTKITSQILKPLPQLLKGSSSYKLIVPCNVEEKIRYLLRKFPSTKWSGVLFYTHQGTFENNDLVITCQDFFPMDLGTSGWTEFKMSEDVAAYMADNVELFSCDTGLIHSHHHLGAFFSGQDNLMLQQEGNDTNCFVSLVVDTKGTYVARVTRKLQSKSKVSTRPLGTSYEFFGDGTKNVPSNDAVTTKVITKEVIEYFNLEVERHKVSNALGYLDARFNEIEKKKAASRAVPFSNASAFSERRTDVDNFFELIGKENSINPTTSDSNNFQSSVDDDYNEHSLSLADTKWTPYPQEVHKAVVHIITCNLILNPDKVNLNQWVAKHMTNIYHQLFGENCEEEASLHISGAFNDWKEFIIQYSLEYFPYSVLSESSIADDPDLEMSIVAKAVYNEMTSLPGFNSNPFLQSYCKALSCYIID